MKLEFEIPDELLSKPGGATAAPATTALSGGPAPDTVAVAGLATAQAEHSLSAGAAEHPAGPAQSSDGVVGSGPAGAGLDGGAAPQA